MATLKSGSQKHIEEFVRDNPDVVEKIRQHYKENPTETMQLRQELEDCDLEVKALYKDKADLEKELEEARDSIKEKNRQLAILTGIAGGHVYRLQEELKQAQGRIAELEGHLGHIEKYTDDKSAYPVETLEGIRRIAKEALQSK